MSWPHWLVMITPVKFWLWFSSRVTAGVGSFVIWKRRRTARWTWSRILVLNLLSWGALILVFLWFHL